MSPLPLVLALLAAALHAGWNLLLKQSGDKNAFTERLLWAAGIGLSPTLAYSIGRGGGVPPAVWPLVAASAVAELIYYVLLGAAYRRGALALVYPAARGTGALLTPLWAYLMLGERPSVIGAGGVVLIAAGLFALWRTHSARHAHADLGKAFLLACGSGVATSSYSVIDKAGISRTPVLPYMAAMFLLTAAFFSIVLRIRGRVGARPAGERARAVAVGFITALTYGMVLWAMTMAKVGYVAAVRESSMVFGILLGWAVLGERSRPAGLIGVSMIVLGVIAIALGG